MTELCAQQMKNIVFFPIIVKKDRGFDPRRFSHFQIDSIRFF